MVRLHCCPLCLEAADIPRFKQLDLPGTIFRSLGRPLFPANFSQPVGPVTSSIP
jgi:hypothetical protein